MKRSLSSVNRPDIKGNNVVDALVAFELIIDVAVEEDADDDDVDACVFGVVEVCCCAIACWDDGGTEGGGGGGGGGNIDDGWWWWCGWRIKSPVVVSFSSTNTTRT